MSVECLCVDVMHHRDHRPGGPLFLFVIRVEAVLHVAVLAIDTSDALKERMVSMKREAGSCLILCAPWLC